MVNNIGKQVVTATLLFVLVLSIIVYNSSKMFDIYDFVYLSVFIVCYIKYLRIKIRQRNYINQSI